MKKHLELSFKMKCFGREKKSLLERKIPKTCDEIFLLKSHNIEKNYEYYFFGCVSFGDSFYSIL